MPLPAVAVPPSGSCIILLSLAQMPALLLPPPPPLPPPSLCVCFRPNSLHPYIPCTSQQQPSAQWWVGCWGSLIRKWNCPQEQGGCEYERCQVTPALLSPLHWAWAPGLDVLLGSACTDRQVSSAGASKPPVCQGAAQQRQDSYFLGHAMWRWHFQIVRTVKPAIIGVSASAVEKGVQKSLVAK